MCATDTDYEKRLPYAFLEDISVRFINSLGPLVDQAQGELSLNDKFLPILKKQIVFMNLHNLNLQEFFNKNPSSDNISHVRNQLDDVKVVMLDNIDRLFDREQQMYQIIGKTDQLNQEAFQFKKGAVTLKKNLFWKRVRCTCYIIIILLVCFINIYT